jgi:hypothetical protein
MIISDINYLENISEDVNGAGAAALLAALKINVDAQSDAAAVVNQEGYTSAQTGNKIVFYSSSIDLLGLT